MTDRLSSSPPVVVANTLFKLHVNGCVPPYEVLLTHSYLKFLRPGDVVFDIGANVGFHLRYFVDAVGAEGRVVAVEPIPSLAQGLRDEFGHHANLEILQAAMGTSPGQSTFNHVVGADPMSGLRQRTDVLDILLVDQIQVEVRTLDSLADRYDRVAYVKMDIEGGEIDCIKGGLNSFFKRHRPIMSVEYGEPSYKPYGYSRESMWDLAQTMSYLPADLFGNLISSREEWMVVADRSAWDFFLVPRERAEEWSAMVRERA
jgi:FkbM family methyltransferase